MKRDLSDVVVVITGASSGIARATALKLAQHRGTVVLASRQEDALQLLARECERLGGRALAVKTDVTQEEQVRNVARLAADGFGRIDAWINAAAVSLLARFEDAPPEVYRRVIETNFFGYVHGARAVLPYFRQQGHGVLVNVASILARVGAPYASAYVASKFAVAGFSESLRMELRDAPDIHVCTVLPTTIDTPLFQHAANYTGRAVQAMPPVHSPDAAADAICQCLVSPRREVYVGSDGPRMVMMRALAPALAEQLAAAKVERQHFQDRPSAHFGGNLFESMPQFNGVTGGWRSNRNGASRGLIAAGATCLAGIVVAALYAWRQPTRVPNRQRRVRKEAADLAGAAA